MFAKLLSDVRRKLKAIQTNPEALKYFIYSYFPRDYISKSSTVDEVFDILTQYKLWNYWNYETLADVVREFAADDPEIKSLMETYKQDLESYRATTNLLDHISDVNATPADEEELEQAEIYDKQYFKTLSVKLKMRFTNHTLKYIDDLWKEFANLYSLPPRVALLDHIHKGCVSVVWLIPSHLAPQILWAPPISGDFCHKHDIKRVEFDGICIYQEEMLHHEKGDRDQQYFVPVAAQTQGN